MKKYDICHYNDEIAKAVKIAAKYVNQTQETCVVTVVIRPSGKIETDVLRECETREKFEHATSTPLVAKALMPIGIYADTSGLPRLMGNADVQTYARLILALVCDDLVNNAY